MKKSFGRIIFIFLISIAVYFIFFRNNIDPYDEIFNINFKTDSLEDIEKKGYINLTGIKSKEDKRVKKFFDSFNSNIYDELKVITEEKNNIILTLFVVDTSDRVIRAYKRPYDAQSIDLIGFSEIKIEKNNSVSEVYIKETYFPTPTTKKNGKKFDWFILYRYAEEK